MPYLFDIAIVVLLVVFAWRGASKGLILSLCGLIAVAVAFFGAQFLSEKFCAPVANIMRPIIAQSFKGAEPKGQVTEQGLPTYTLDELLEAVQKEGLFEGFSTFLEQGVEKDAVEEEKWASPLDALASYLSKGVAKALLFGLVFIGILLVWFLASHALDLAFQLPGLNEVNLIAGLVLGVVKGVLLTMVLVWLGQLAGLIPIPPDTPIVSLFTLDRLWEILDGLPA